MGDNHNFYGGSNYGLDPDYGDSLGFSYKFPASTFGMPTDPRTANQIKAVSDKLNTGVKVIEVSAITPETLDYIPKQHFDEIRRLKELTGTELTLHGPLVEATGVTRQGWDENQRLQAERQMFSAVEKAKQLGDNTIVTFHASNGLPEPETRVLDPKTGKEITTEMYVVDEREGRFTQIKPKENYLTGENDPLSELKKSNKDAWYRALQHVNFNAYSGSQSISHALSPRGELSEEIKEALKNKPLLNYYQDYATGKGDEVINEAKKIDPNLGKIIESKMTEITHGDIYLRDAYQELQNLFNQAYDTAKRNNAKEDKGKLEKYQREFQEKFKDITKPSHVKEFADEILKGVNVLRSIDTPQTLKPLREFAVEKAGDTFGNVAFDAYKKFGDKSPIISIENPPAGSGLNRGEDLRDVVEKSRAQFIERAMEEKGMSKEDAKQAADKLIGVTWDVGHINMIRKFGHDNKQLIKETEAVAPYIKHIHLSDNFGLEHTELPMGMGNVPIKEHLAVLQKKYGDKIKDIKQVVETGGWYQFFKRSPLPETLAAFGSPVYSMKMAPVWNQAYNTHGGYFAGYGQMLPEGNFSIYGAGFSGLPTELGGQVGGRNRFSGAPME